MSIFEDRFHLGPSDFTDVLETALSRGGDFAELFFEYRLHHSILIEEQIIKETAESVGLGLGIRVWSGDQTGFGYTNDLSPERMKKAARSAAAIAVAGGAPSPPAAFVSRSPLAGLYPVAEPAVYADLGRKIALVREAYEAALKVSPAIKKAKAALGRLRPAYSDRQFRGIDRL